MRISSATFYNSTLPAMQTAQSTIARLNEQVATGQRILAPKDDPLDTKQAMELSNRVATREQYLANQQKAELSLKMEATVLETIHTTLTKARSLAVSSVASQDDTLQAQHGDRMAAYYSQLKDLINTRDSNGAYLFAGERVTTRPFEHTQAYPGGTASTATNYLGTPYGDLNDPAGGREITVSQDRAIQISDNLDPVLRSGSVGGVPGNSDSDLLRIMDQFAMDIRDTSSSAAQKQFSIKFTIDSLTNAIDSLTTVQSRVAASLSELEDITTTTENLQLLEKNALSDLTLVDKAAAIVEMQSRQTALQAAQQAYAQTSKLSLFSFM